MSIEAYPSSIVSYPASGLSGTIANSQLDNSTISGVSLGSNLNTLTIGTGLSGTSYNGSSAVTIANSGVLSINGSTGALTNVVLTDAANTITAASASTKPLILKGAASQSANYFEIQNSSGTVLANITSSGTFFAQSLSSSSTGYQGNIASIDGTKGSLNFNTSGYGLIVTSAQASAVVLTARSAASQTGDLQQWQNSSGTVLAKVDASGSVTAVDLTLSGNLTVNGTTTNLNSTNLVVEDKNIIIADVATPSDTTADGGGITIKGATDKTFNWVSATSSFTASENIDLASSKTFKIAGTDVLTASAVLGKAVPSGTIVGTTDSQTLTNKTLTSPVISSISNTGTITVPTTTGTLALTSQVINNTLTTTTGDMIYASGSNTPARLAIGTTGQVLTVAGGVPTWAAASGGGGAALSDIFMMMGA